MKKSILKSNTLLKLFLVLVAIAAIVLLSKQCNNYQLTIVNSAIIYFISAMGYTVMLGMGGMMPMATVTFMGFGAFFTAQLSKNFGLPTPLAGLLAVAGATLIAYILSIMLVRLSSYYFVFGTIGLCNMMATVFQNYKPLTNGADGINGIPKLELFGFQFRSLSDWCLLLSGIALIIMFIVSRIRKSSLGRSLMSIRDNAVAAETLGVNIRRTKRIAFTIGSMFSAIAGMLVAYHNGVVSASLFTFNVQQNLLMMVMLGGINSTVGALGGAFLIQFMPEMLRPIQEYMRLIQGIMLILLMIFMPMGIHGLIKTAYEKLKGKIMVKKEVSRVESEERTGAFKS
ncbi:branched-chain amino acid ABC transporter permease [Feifania hominis]|uniref:Branched-chain amino acid ABC transporter permease n=1 Tax=Feifania hominis TaxID=2763660 RepID=A0A926HPC7_9FIRM|nr:branched-chain amino acid ABC transporter permease [Feifania hominis]MBC8535142.1 branched-chain amino acid ABC transporter permease [Feifania hominis]